MRHILKRVFTLIKWNAFVKIHLFLPYLCIYSFIHWFLSVWTHGNLFIIWTVFGHQITLLAQLVPALALRSFVRLATHVPPFLEHFSFLWFCDMLQAHRVFSLSQHWYQLFLQGALVLFTGEQCLESKLCGPWVCSLVLGCHCF